MCIISCLVRRRHRRHRVIIVSPVAIVINIIVVSRRTDAHHAVAIAVAVVVAIVVVVVVVAPCAVTIIVNFVARRAVAIDVVVVISRHNWTGYVAPSPSSSSSSVATVFIVAIIVNFVARHAVTILVVIVVVGRRLFRSSTSSSLSPFTIVIAVVSCRIKVKNFKRTNHLIPDWKIMIIHFTYFNGDPTCSMSIILFSSGDWLFVFFSSLGFSLTVVIKM